MTGFLEQHTGHDGLRTARIEEILGEGECAARLENVINDQDIAARGVGLEIPHDTDPAGRRGRLAITRQCKEIDLW